MEMYFCLSEFHNIFKDSLCFNIQLQDAVVSFPLYTEALRFAHHEEKMIQTAIRSLVLNVYNGILLLYRFELPISML